MKKLEYQVSFATPAFLGNARQAAQWRTPPFKALIRHWWRIVKAPEVGYDHAKLRCLEGDLFGNAWLEGDFRKSAVRIRLSTWESGKLQSADWPGGAIEKVVTTLDGKGSVRADLYLGYGPVLAPSRREGRNGIEIRGAVKPSATASFRLAFPSSYTAEITQTLNLIRLFGALGSRARNGWGSVVLTDVDDRQSWALDISREIQRVARPLEQCLEQDWPHAVGADTNGTLVWRTSPCKDWRQVMGRLANVRVAVRRIAKQREFQGPRDIAGIHLLGYPAGGKWQLPAWHGRGQDEAEGRLASQLRFKVIMDSDSSCYGVVAHLPCRLPDELAKRLDPPDRHWLSENELRVWRAVHRGLDSERKLERME